MASYDSDDTDESVVRAFEDAIRLGIETGGPEDDRLQYYASSRSTSDQCRQDPNHEGQERGNFDFPAHRRPHDAGLGGVESFEEFGSTDVPAARRLETVRRVRYMKYEQQWNEPSHVGGSVSKNTRLEEKEISERQAVQLLQDPHVLPQPQTIGHGAVNTRDTQHHGKTDFHLHLTQHVTNIRNPTAVTVGGKVTVRPDLEEYEPKHDIVPSETQILRSETENRIQEWIEGMVPTEASRIIAEMLLQGRTWVTVIGGPGEGKTTAAYMALKSLHNNGREVYDVHSPEDYFKLKGSKGPVLMLNDIFGSSHFDLSNLTKWTTVLNDILSMKEHRGVRNIRKNKGVVPFSVRGERNLTLHKRKLQPSVILVSRSCVLASASQHLGRYKDLIYDADGLVDLTGDRKSSPEERIKIWEYHADSFDIVIHPNVVKEVCSMTHPYGFPHCCKLFANMYYENSNLCMKTFFSKPLEFLNHTMESYMGDLVTGKLLREILRHDGSLQLDNIFDDETRYQFKTVVGQLKGLLLSQDGDFVRFHHPSIYESAAFVMCMKDPMFVVTKCTMSFLNDRVRFQGLHGKNVSDIVLTTTVNKIYVKPFIERSKEELENGNIFWALSHESFHDEGFLAQFMDKILPLSGFQPRTKSVGEMIHKRDRESGHSVLFLSSVSQSDKILRYICNFVELSHDEQMDALFGICEHRSVSSLKYFLSQFGSTDLNVRNTDLQTPLLVSATKASEDMLKLLLEKDVDVSVTDKDGNTALHHICDVGVDGDGTVVKMLIERGASINTESQIHPFIPIHLACVRGHVNVLTALIDGGASVNKQDLWDDTPLHVSCTEGHVNVVAVLLERGANLNKQNTWGDTPIYLASSIGHFKVVKMLLDKGADANLKNHADDTPLCAAIVEGNLNVVTTLIAGAAAINMKGPLGDTPLYMACLSGHFNIVGVLLDHGADVNMTTSSGDTPLCASCARRNVDVVKALLDKGADINQTGRFGDTPLCAACVGGSISIVTAVLAEGAEVNQIDNRDNTPLHVACAQGHPDVVKLLLCRGASINVTDRNGYRPVDVARDNVTILMESHLYSMDTL